MASKTPSILGGDNKKPLNQGGFSPVSTNIDHNTKVLINMLFARFEAIYGNKFTSGYGNERMLSLAKREWALSLNGYTEQQLQRGLNRSKLESEWPPAISTFIQFTKPLPQECGLPEAVKAYEEVTRYCHRPNEHDWSHPLIRRTGQDVGWRQLSTQPEKTTFPLFSKHYMANIERLMQGEVFDIPEPVKQVPSPDYFLEGDLVKEILGKGGTESLAYQTAYYLEKPNGSSLRAYYRDQALKVLKKHNIDVDLPE